MTYINTVLQKVKNITSESCVTIVLNTNRTQPDNKVDSITLKNLCKRAEERLLAHESKKEVEGLIQQIKELASQIDHSSNQESLILFVNEDMAEYTRLPILVNDRVVIDRTFATRDLVRALHKQFNYLVLVLSQQKVRMIEAFNDKVVKEYDKDFPIRNTQFYATSKVEISNATRQTNLIAEFFNRVDKEVNKVRHQNPLPVLLCSEKSNYHEYLKVADQKGSIFESFLRKNYLDEKPHHIVGEAWVLVKEQLIQRINLRKQELMEAVNKGNFLSDINDIYKGILAGKVRTLFLEEGLFQPGKIENGTISFVSEDERTQKMVIDDIYDELIEINLNFGGETVFLPKGEISHFKGFGAVTRY